MAIFIYMRLVLINTPAKTATVYEGRIPLAQYTIEGVVSAEEIEYIRTLEYKDKA